MKTTTIVILIIIVFIVLVNSLYIIDEREQIIITQFGEPIGDAHKDAGLHFKLPFIQTIHRFERRILQWDGEPNQIPTSDKKFLWVDVFARWRIEDPLLFFQSVGTEMYAQSRLDDIIDGTTRDIVTLNTLSEIVRNTDRHLQLTEDLDTDHYEEIQDEIISVGRRAIADSIFIKSKEDIKAFGIELIDVQIKRVNYIEDVRKQVYERMSSERKKIADMYRSAGQGRAAEIIGTMERDLQQIESEAYRESEEIKGRADAEAAAIYASAFNQDPEFYGFMRSLEAYKKTIDDRHILILSTDSEFYKLLKQSR